MTFASPPAAAGSTSITMTATTASDPSGVEYRFNNVTLGTSSPWQDSPVYTATGPEPRHQLHLHRAGPRQEPGPEHHHRLRSRQCNDPERRIAGCHERQFLRVWRVKLRELSYRHARSGGIRRGRSIQCKRLAELRSPVGTGFPRGIRSRSPAIWGQRQH